MVIHTKCACPHRMSTLGPYLQRVRESEQKAVKNYEYGQHMAALLAERSSELRDMQAKWGRANDAHAKVGPGHSFLPHPPPRFTPSFLGANDIL